MKRFRSHIGNTPMPLQGKVEEAKEFRKIRGPTAIARNLTLSMLTHFGHPVQLIARNSNHGLKKERNILNRQHFFFYFLLRTTACQLKSTKHLVKRNSQTPI